MCEWQNRDATQQQVPAEEKLDILVKRRADKSPVPLRQRQRTYDLSEGREALIRYEDLKADALGTMCNHCSALRISTAEEQLT